MNLRIKPKNYLVRAKPEPEPEPEPLLVLTSTNQC